MPFHFQTACCALKLLGCWGDIFKAANQLNFEKQLKKKMSLTKAIQPPEPPPYVQTGFFSSPQQQQPMGKTKVYAPEQVQRIIMTFIEQQQQNQQDEPKVVTVNPMEILYGFMSFFSSWKQNVPACYNTSSAEMSGAEDSTRFSKADKVDLLSDEDVVNCFVIIMHCIVRDRYTEPALFTNYIRQSIDSIVQMGRLQARSRNF